MARSDQTIRNARPLQVRGVRARGRQQQRFVHAVLKRHPLLAQFAAGMAQGPFKHQGPIPNRRTNSVFVPPIRSTGSKSMVGSRPRFLATQILSIGNARGLRNPVVRQDAPSRFLEADDQSSLEVTELDAQDTSALEQPAVQERVSVSPFSETVSSEAVPSEAVPSEAVPSEAVPSEAVPSEAVSSETVPSETVPSETVPSETVLEPAIVDVPGAFPHDSDSAEEWEHERKPFKHELDEGMFDEQSAGLPGDATPIESLPGAASISGMQTDQLGAVEAVESSHLDNSARANVGKVLEQPTPLPRKPLNPSEDDGRISVLTDASTDSRDTNGPDTRSGFSTVAAENGQPLASNRQALPSIQVQTPGFNETVAIRSENTEQQNMDSEATTVIAPLNVVANLPEIPPVAETQKTGRRRKQTSNRSSSDATTLEPAKTPQLAADQMPNSDLAGSDNLITTPNPEVSGSSRIDAIPNPADLIDDSSLQSGRSGLEQPGSEGSIEPDGPSELLPQIESEHQVVDKMALIEHGIAPIQTDLDGVAPIQTDLDGVAPTQTDDQAEPVIFEQLDRLNLEAFPEQNDSLINTDSVTSGTDVLETTNGVSQGVDSNALDIPASVPSKLEPEKQSDEPLPAESIGLAETTVRMVDSENLPPLSQIQTSSSLQPTSERPVNGEESNHSTAASGLEDLAFGHTSLRAPELTSVGSDPQVPTDLDETKTPLNPTTPGITASNNEPAPPVKAKPDNLQDARVVETYGPRGPRRVPHVKPTQEHLDSDPVEVPVNSVQAAKALTQETEAIEQLFRVWRNPEDQFASHMAGVEETVPVQPMQGVEKPAPTQVKGLESGAATFVTSEEAGQQEMDPLLAVLFQVWTRPEDRYTDPNPHASQTKTQSQHVPVVGDNVPADRPKLTGLPEDAVNNPRTRNTGQPQAFKPTDQTLEVEEAIIRPEGPPQDGVPPAFRASLPSLDVPSPPDASPPEPLLETTRRFLKPLLGIDLDSARVHRGAHADALASSQQADAVTLGQDVFLANGHPDGDPRTLGLLAHELTHVARGPKPRFVPPVVQEEDGFSTDEEDLAEEVESLVLGEAQTQMGAGQMKAIRPVDGTVASNEPDWPSALAQGEFHRRAESAVNGPDPWNGLPAPWEPMTSMDSMPMPVPVSSPIEAPRAGLQTARRGRQVEAAHAEAERHEPPANNGVEQDLDALARQVYGILKRRLEAESRRGL